MNMKTALPNTKQAEAIMTIADVHDRVKQAKGIMRIALQASSHEMDWEEENDIDYAIHAAFELIKEADKILDDMA